MKNHARLTLGASFIFLVSCAPVYRDFYDFKPIPDRYGSLCANNCMTTNQLCRSHEEQAAQSCNMQAQAAYSACESSKIYGWDYKHKEWECISNCYCFQSSCAEPDYASCERFQANCHVNCGGEVVKTTKCVQNCEEALPAKTEVLGAKVAANAGATKVSRQNPTRKSAKNSTDEGGGSQLEAINRNISDKLGKD